MMTRKSVLKLAVSSLIMSATLASCAGSGQEGRPQSLSSKAEKSLAKGNPAKAIMRAEEAVRIAPRDANSRVVLAQAYLGAGRFVSAEKTFEDAIELGDTSARTVISLALAHIANGKTNDARNLLADNRDMVPVSDYGFAIALAGDTKQGVKILEDLVRNGVNSPKVRQNLAYVYALDGRWRESKLLAAQDVSPEEANARILQWARMARPDLAAPRVAAILGVSTDNSDTGQPAQLALIEQTDNDTAVAITEAVITGKPVPEFAKAKPLENVALPASEVTVPQEPVKLAAAAPVPIIAAPQKPMRSAPPKAPAAPAARVTQPRSLATPVASTLAPSAKPAEIPAKAVTAPKPLAKAAFRAEGSRSVETLREGAYIVQLGAFSSTNSAQRAWSYFSGRFGELKGFDYVSTPTISKGKTLHRLSAVGFGNRQSALAMCDGLKARGGSCIVRQTTKSAAGTKFARR